MSEITEIRDRWERYKFELNEEWRRKFTENAMLGNAAPDIDYLLNEVLRLMGKSMALETVVAQQRAELARLQAECTALTVIAEERAQKIYRMQQIADLVAGKGTR